MHVADHDYGKKRIHLQPIKKVNCPATIVAKEIILFPDFQVQFLIYIQKLWFHR